jgi:hypothetical protein
MPKRLAWLAIVVPMIAALSGCIYETTIDAQGAGEMTAAFTGIKRQTLDVLKAKLASSSVTVLSADFTGSPDNGRAVIKLRFDDILKLSTTEFFRNATFTRSQGSGGTTVLTAVVRNNTKAPELSDTVLAKLGSELKSVVTFPGDVVESNGTISGGRSVAWTWNLREFFKQPEVLMTAAYKLAGSGGVAGDPGQAAPTPASGQAPGSGGQAATPAAAGS